VELEGGRSRQKNRTRRELLAAARRLLARNVAITVDVVATEAEVSRTTAYRYFPDADALLLEAVLDGQAASPEQIVGDCEDVRERVHRVRAHLTDLVRASESTYRMYLSRAVVSPMRDGKAPQPQMRGGRRIAMYEHALAPARPALGEKTFRDLVLSLSAVSGVESFVVLRDVCCLDDGTADRIAGSILDAILDRHLP
jgi:AcrR family transcriptional regulator